MPSAASICLQLLLAAEAVSRPSGADGIASLLQRHDGDAIAAAGEPFASASHLIGKRLASFGCLASAAASFATAAGASAGAGSSGSPAASAVAAGAAACVDALPVWTLLREIAAAGGLAVPAAPAFAASAVTASPVTRAAATPRTPASAAAGTPRSAAAAAGAAADVVVPLSSLPATRVTHALVAALLPILRSAPAPETAAATCPAPECSDDDICAVHAPGSTRSKGGRKGGSGSGSSALRSGLRYDHVTVHGLRQEIVLPLFALWRAATAAAVPHALVGLKPASASGEADAAATTAAAAAGASAASASAATPAAAAAAGSATPATAGSAAPVGTPAVAAAGTPVAGLAATPASSVIVHRLAASGSGASASTAAGSIISGIAGIGGIGATPRDRAASAALERLSAEAGRALVDAVTRLMGHIDFDAQPEEAASPRAVAAIMAAHGVAPTGAPRTGTTAAKAAAAEAAAKAAAALADVSPEPVNSWCLSAYRAALRQRGGDVFGTTAVQLIRRVAGLNSPAVHANTPHTGAEAAAPAPAAATAPAPAAAAPASAATPAGTAAAPPAAPSSTASAGAGAGAGFVALLNRSRVTALREAGVFRTAALALAVHASSTLYAREAIRLLVDIAEECALGDGHDVLTGEGVVAALGLDELCLRSLQSAVKKHGEEGGDVIVRDEGGKLLTALSEVFTSLSSRGFLDALQRCVEAAEACRHQRIPKGASAAAAANGTPVAAAASAQQQWAYQLRGKAARESRVAAMQSATAASGGSKAAGKDAFMSEKGTGPALNEQPEDFAALLAAAEALLVVCEGIEADAIPPLPDALIIAARNALGAYARDARIAGIISRALVRAADNIANVEPLADPSVVTTLVGVGKTHAGDAFVAEPAAAFFRPLSVFPECVAVMKDCGAVPLLVDLASRHKETLLPSRTRGNANANKAGGAGGAGGGGGKAGKAGSTASIGSAAGGSGSGSSAGAADVEVDADVLRALASPTASAASAAQGFNAASPSASGQPGRTGPPPPAAVDPRIAHHAVQVLANVACDQEPEGDGSDDAYAAIPRFEEWEAAIGEGCPGGVARIVAADGVSAIAGAIRAHLGRPRLLEDALCAMSNIAYATDGTRLLVGRTAARDIVRVLSAFNGDAYLFSMALRAVGNLTRCDENIIAAVGQGAIAGITQGMAAHAEDVDVLRLAADVVGNLASIDEEAIDRAEGLRALREGIASRAAAAAEAASAATAAAGAGGDGSTTAAAAAAAPPLRSPRVADDVSLQDAVVDWLLDDRAHIALVDAMVAHHDDAALVSACLRSLQYCAESRRHCERMEAETQLAKQTVFVLRSCDFDAELCCRGALLLAQLLRHRDSPCAAAAAEAGAHQVLLSVLDTHQHDYEVASAILKVLLLLGAGAPPFLAAAGELSSPLTLLRIMAEARCNMPGAAGAASGSGGGAGRGSTTSAIGAARGPASADPRASAMGGDGGVAAAAAAASGADGDQPQHRRVLGLPAADSTLLVRQCIAVLTAFAADGGLASMAAPAAVAGAIDLLLPAPPSAAASAAASSAAASSGAQAGASPRAGGAAAGRTASSGGAGSGGSSAGSSSASPTNPLWTDGVLQEATAKLMSALAAGGGPTVAAALVDAGVMRLVTPLATHTPLVDRSSLSGAILTLLNAIAGAGADAAFAAMQANAHGVAGGIAAHWCLKTAGDPAARQAVYDAAGTAVRALEDASEAPRRRRAVAEARARLEAALAADGGGSGGSSGGGGGLSSTSASNLSLAARSASVKGLLKAEAAGAKVAAKRREEAERLASKGAHGAADAAALLELRPGVMPWDLFPAAEITALVESGAGGDDVTASVWFLPSMFAATGGAPKPKVRRMRLSLSEDLRILTLAYDSKHHQRELRWTIRLADAAHVRVGAPPPLKGGLFASKPHAERGVLVEAADGSPLLHLECGKAEEHDSLLRTLYTLTCYARARAGVPEPLPELPVSVATLLAGEGDE